MTTAALLTAGAAVLAPGASASLVYVDDGFVRSATVSSGLGSPDGHLTYSGTATGWSVTSGAAAAVVTAGDNRRMTALIDGAPLSLLDTQARIRFKLSALPSAGTVSVGVAVRQDSAGNRYTLRAQVGSGGATTLVAAHVNGAGTATTTVASASVATAVVVGTQYELIAQVDGGAAPVLRAKLLLAGGSSSTWNVNTAVSSTSAPVLSGPGGDGLFVQAASMTSQTITATLDDYRVTTVEHSASGAIAATASGRTVAFDASAVGDPDGAITTYDWSFGDGSTPTTSQTQVPTTSFTYPAYGSYTLTLKVTDAKAGVTTLTKAVTVADTVPPVTATPSRSTSDPVAAQPYDVHLTWTPATDDGGIGGYSVYRDTTATFTPSPATLVATLSGSVTSWTDPLLRPGTYYYRLVARDVAGNTAPSPAALVVEVKRFAQYAGAAAPGTATYTPDAGTTVLKVSQATPLPPGAYRTIKEAVAAAPAAPTRTTIAVGAGYYHEKVELNQGKLITLQPDGNAAVWLDGSEAIPYNSPATGTPQWASSVSGSTSLWSYASYLLMSHASTGSVGTGTPAVSVFADQVWYGSGPSEIELRQVATKAELATTPRAFYVEIPAGATTTGTLWVNVNPSTSTVSASTLKRALTIEAPGAVVRGIGVRRFAPGMGEAGAVTITRNGGTATPSDITLEHVTVDHAATNGIWIGSKPSAWDVLPRMRLSNVTITNSGWLGLSAAYCNDLTLERLKVDHNNTLNFAHSPVAGGVKVTTSLRTKVLDSLISNNTGPGVWFDQSSSDTTVTGNDVLNNTGEGLYYEISDKVLFADNTVVQGSLDASGIKVSGSSHATVENNTIVGGAVGLELIQDPRTYTQCASGSSGDCDWARSPRPAMTWVLQADSIKNNVLADPTRGLLWDGQRGLLVVKPGVGNPVGNVVSSSALDGNAYQGQWQDDPAHSPQYAKAVATWGLNANGDAVPYETFPLFKGASSAENSGVWVATGYVSSSGVSQPALAAEPTAPVAGLTAWRRYLPTSLNWRGSWS